LFIPNLFSIMITSSSCKERCKNINIKTHGIDGQTIICTQLDHILEYGRLNQKHTLKTHATILPCFS